MALQGSLPNSETSARAPYLSTPIDSRKTQIRVVHLQPRAGNDDIFCTLEVIDLDDTARQEYYALSYKWGDANTSGCEIILTGVKVAVRTNLWWALWHLREEDKDITIWIDALCIEQENGAERNHQVQQMSKVYSKALKVIAWIGVEDLAFPSQPSSTIAQAIVPMDDLHNSGLGSPDYAPTSKPELAAAYERFDYYSRLNLLDDILGRSYWDRVWIIQELILAKCIEIRGGRHTITWKSLNKTYEAAENHRRNISPVYTNYELLQHERWQRSLWVEGMSNPRTEWWYRSLWVERMPNPRTLFDLFGAFTRSKCSDPRDKVYCLLSLAPSCCQQAIKVDYNKTAPAIGMLMVEHELKHHGSNYLLECWGLEQIMKTLERHALLDPPTKELLPISGFSLQAEKTTAIDLRCRFLGHVSKVKKHEKPDRSLSKHGIVVWTAELHTKSKKVTLCTTNPIEPRDLVYRTDRRNFLLLREESGDCLLMLGWAHDPNFDDHQLPLLTFAQKDHHEREYYKDRLHLDISALFLLSKIVKEVSGIHAGLSLQRWTEWIRRHPSEVLNRILRAITSQNYEASKA